MSEEMSKVRPKTGGRTKGTPNKRSWNLRLELEAAGFEPIKEMIALLQTTTDPDKKWARLEWMVQYLYPKLKEIEAPAEVGDEEPDHASERDTEALLSLAMAK